MTLRHARKKSLAAGAIGRHTKVLEQAQLVRVEKKGRERLDSIELKSVEQLHDKNARIT